MKRKEEIKQAAEEMGLWGAGEAMFIFGAEWADKTMVERACKCYCDIICDIGRCGMCFHKHDGQGQMKNDFKYNECNTLKIIINDLKHE